MSGFARDLLDLTMREREVELTTFGRKTGQPRRVTVWIWGDGTHLYIRSGGGLSRDWPCNLLANPRAILHLGDVDVPVRARRVTDPAEARLGAVLINQKYGTDFQPTAPAEALNAAEEATFELLPADTGSP